MEQQLHIILPTDAFPPGNVGGSAWSSFTLAQALAQRGHRVTVVLPRRGRRGERRLDQGAIAVVEVGYRAPAIPFVQNYFRFERLWQTLARTIERLAREQSSQRSQPVVIHGQHAQSIPAAVLAGRRLGLPTVGTVRDYWPFHYFSTGLLGDRAPIERFGPAATALDLLLRSGPLRGIAALGALPYVLSHVRRRAALLAEAGAVIAVSRYVAQRLAGLVPQEKLHVIPNPVDFATIDRIIAAEPESRIDGPFALYAGKLERNKGAHLLPAVAAEALKQGAHRWTLVIAGQGALRGEIEREISQLELPVRFLDWASHDEVLRLMARCAALIFPSGWAEPLSRVLIEAAALGTPIAALATGGTPDIIEDGVSGLLAHTAEGLGRALAQLLLHPQRAEELGRQARRAAEQRFAAPTVAARHEALYRALVTR